MIDSNYDDIFMRNATVTLIDLLHTELTFKTVEDGKIVENKVRFMFSASSQEQFMKDFFMGLPADCRVDGYAEGNYETLPLGVIHMPPKIQVQTKDLTNKFVRAAFVDTTVNEKGEKIPIGKNARLLALPIEISFSVEIRVANLNHLFKVLESVLETFFQNRVAFFQYRGMRIQSQFRFPESIDLKKAEQFDFTTTDNYISMTIPIVMETYFPVFDKHSMRNSTNVIQQFNVGMSRDSNNETLSGIVGKFVDQDHPSVE